MSFIYTFLISLLFFAIGLGLLLYNFQLVQMVGHNSMAERYFGEGGSYTAWKLVGIVLMVASIWYLFH